MSSEVRQFAAASMEFVKCLGHPEEFYNLLRFQMGGRRKVMPKMDQVGRASLHPGGAGRLRATAGFWAWPAGPRIQGQGCGQRVPNASGSLLPSGEQSPDPCQAALPFQPGSPLLNQMSGPAALGLLGIRPHPQVVLLPKMLMFVHDIGFQVVLFHIAFCP